MIVRNFHLVIATQLVYVVICQNARSYDTSDWVPITQKTNEGSATKKAKGRVLNLDAPAQKFFPDEEYLYRKRRPNTQQPLNQKERYNIPKFDKGYKFEEVPTVQQNGNPKLQYFTNQEVKLPNYEQPPPLEEFLPPPRQSYGTNAQPAIPNTRPKAPSPNAPNLYEQYNIPLNASSFYQSLNPGSINHELLGAIQFQQSLGGIQSPPNRIVQGTDQRVVQGTDQRVVQGSERLTSKKPDIEKEEVQLVYVPLENLKANQPLTQDTQTIYRQIEPPRYENLMPSQQVRLEAIENDFIQQAFQAHRLQEQFQEGQPILLQPRTTPAPKLIKKRKPHQPPLAVYIEGGNRADVADVLDVLKDAKSIAVRDSVQPDSPQIFIGPSSLSPPEGYTKFPLPYLNNINGNRVERKIDQLPFFIAPLSFKAPSGYSKIPLPAPHVGSVVISNNDDPHDKRSTPKPNQILQYQQREVDVSPVTTKIASVDNVTPQAYIGQDFYNQGQFLASQRPQYLQFTVNDNVQQYEIPSSTASAESQYGSNSRIPSHVTSENSYVTTSKTHYEGQQEDGIRSPSRNVANPNNGQQLPADIQEFSVPSQQLIENQYYDQSFNDDHLSKIPSRNQQDYQMSYQRDQNKYSSKANHKTRYEPISTTFESNYKSSVPDSSLVNITPKIPSSTPIPEKDQVSHTYTTSDQRKPEIPDINSLELAINEFELHQINTQLEEHPRMKNQYTYDSDSRNQHHENRNRYHQQTTEESEYKFDPELHRFSSTPASILRDSNVETTVRPTSKSRRRGRPTRPPTTTVSTPEKETYTVLEEFTARQPANHEYPRAPGVQYASEIEQIPTRVHTLRTTTNNYGSVQNINEFRSSTPQYEVSKTEIEDIPARVYSLNVLNNAPVYHDAVQPHTQQLDQTLMDHQVLQGESKQDIPQYNEQYEINSLPQQHSVQQYEVQLENQAVEHNRAQNYEHSDENRDSGKFSLFENTLEDPSVRSLLKTNLLVPTTTDGVVSYAAPKYLPTTESAPATTTTTTTTERYIETTTRSRTRGRQRGGSRYNVQTTRRPVTRRRPTHSSRTTTESQQYSAETNDFKKVNTRQRFRTRGRVNPNAIVDRPTTTENEIYNSPTSESAIEIHQNKPSESQSHVKYEHTVHDEVFPTAEPNDEVSENYYKVRLTSQRPFLHYENTATTPRGVLNVQITHPVDEEQQRVQPQREIVHRKQESPREAVRVRGRIRRPTTTTEATTRRTTTPRQITKEEGEEEFYGFLRQPNFGSPAQQVETTTAQPSSSHQGLSGGDYYSRHEVADDHPNFENAKYDSTTLRFVGEIVPKYQTTGREVEPESETEAPKPRSRGRVRVPQRPSSQKNSYEDSRPLEQATRRSNVVRSRGRTHYRLPDNLKKESDEDDVEGGNYPPLFFQNKQPSTTRAPTFQITVDPIGDEDADQAPHPSIYRPNVVRPEEWHDASEYAGDEGQTFGNTIEHENKEDIDQLTTTAQPVALAIKAMTAETITAKGEEVYRESTKSMENIFETINTNYEKVTENPKSKGRRRGVWKLVKQRPLDRLATAESQNYYSVLNAFSEIQKTNHEDSVDHHDKSHVKEENSQIFESGNKESQEQTTKYTTSEPEKEEIISDSRTNTQETIEALEEETKIPVETSSLATTTTSEPEKVSFFDNFYQMFGVSNEDKEEAEASRTLQPDVEEETHTPATTIVTPTFPEEMTELPSSPTTGNITETPVETTTMQEEATTVEADAETSQFEVEPWEMKAVRTSTSTEVSHETEICYKGRCIKSREKKKKF